RRNPSRTRPTSSTPKRRRSGGKLPRRSPGGSSGPEILKVRARSIALAALAIVVLSSAPVSAAPSFDERQLPGDPVEGRRIRVAHRGAPDETRVLVVGCI